MKRKLFTTADIILLVALLIFGCLCPRFFMGKQEGKSMVEVTLDGKLLGSYSLEEDRILYVSCSSGDEGIYEMSEAGYEHFFSLERDSAIVPGYNFIIIKNGGVSVSDADCKGHDCVKTGVKTRQGSVIACLPHKLMITVVGADEQGTDVVVY